MWVRCCPRVAVMGVENTLSRKRRLICEQHGGCKKRDLQFVAASTTVKRPDEVQSHILLVTGRAGSEMDAGHYHRESSKRYCMKSRFH
ncbi:hypothetical protein TNCV_2338871 [Trichonephila clavipes]|nr:hypothetical protein TNCV_2338871 [Trichonephila clavipes]